MVYTTSQLQQITGRDKEGRLISWGIEQPYFYLTLQQRVDIFRLSSPVFGVVSSRMNRISGLEFNIVTERYKEDEIVQDLRDKQNIYNEYDNVNDIGNLTIRAMIYKELLEYMPELKPDLTNFDASLLRWKRRTKQYSAQTCDNAKNWLMEVNQGVSWEDFVKKWVCDYHVHGSASIYKREENGKIENFDVLPGGTVYRIKGETFNTIAGYVQIIPFGFGAYTYMEPQIYFNDEIVYSEYIPSSSRAYGMIPLEALINKIAETLMFDVMMANQADGTKPPEKMVIVTNNNPFGSLDDSEKKDLPLDVAEQSRIEEKINEPSKNSIMTFSGNAATVVDLSRENTMATQMQRQKDIREEVALVFNMSNMEVNLTGSGDTSGRSTSEAQAEIEQGKGIAPPAKALANAIQKGIFPFKFGSGFLMEWEFSSDPKEQEQLDALRLQNGKITVNELREVDNKSGYGEEYDKPTFGNKVGEVGNSEMNPMFMRNVQ